MSLLVSLWQRASIMHLASLWLWHEWIQMRIRNTNHFGDAHKIHLKSQHVIRYTLNAEIVSTSIVIDAFVR